MIDFSIEQKTTLFFTPLGWMGVQWAENQVIRLTFGHSRRHEAIDIVGDRHVTDALTPPQSHLVARLKSFASGDHVEFEDVSVDLSAVSSFQQRVLRRCRKIKWGETVSYGKLAKMVGNPAAARAVGTAMKRNPIPIIIPCHRIVRSGGKHLGGFSAPGGVSLKLRMLSLENRVIPVVT